MTIGICDDIEYVRKEIFEICRIIEEKTKSSFEIIEFENGEAVIDQKEKLDILILDIQLPGLNGIDIKNMAEQQEWHILLIFVTGYENFVRDAFGYNVIGFVDKIQLQKKLPRKLSYAIELYDRRQKNRIFINNKIDSRCVKYVRAEHIYCNIVQNSGKSELIRCSISNLEKELQAAGFIRVHRSYLVNMDWIDKVRYRKIWVGEKEIPVSVKRWAIFKQIFAGYET